MIEFLCYYENVLVFCYEKFNKSCYVICGKMCEEKYKC